MFLLFCPVQTFRLMNINPVPKMIRNTPSSTLGFPMLEELCIASSSHSFMNDQDLINILHGSPHLRVLDLRGCSRITAAGLYALPCEGKMLYVPAHCMCINYKCSGNTLTNVVLFFCCCFLNMYGHSYTIRMHEKQRLAVRLEKNVRKECHYKLFPSIQIHLTIFLSP